MKPVPFSGGFKVQGGTATTDELVAQVERGILVTPFWYIRGADPRTGLYTGLTRDGVFLIENGKVTRRAELPVQREPGGDAQQPRGAGARTA